MTDTVFSVMHVQIPDRENDRYVFLPKDPGQWAVAMKESMEHIGNIQMYVDNIAHGCGACAIGFFPEALGGDAYSAMEEGEGFSIVVSRDTLKAIKDMIDFAYEHSK